MTEKTPQNSLDGQSLGGAPERGGAEFQKISTSLNGLAKTGSQIIRNWRLHNALHQYFGTALRWLFVFPIVSWGVLSVFGASWGSRGWPLLLVALALLVVWYLCCVLARGLRKSSRLQALNLCDRQLGLNGRLVIADEFLKADKKSGFVRAAIVDAECSLQKLDTTSLRPLVAVKPVLGIPHWLGSAAAVMVFFTAFLITPQGQGSRVNGNEVSHVTGAETSGWATGTSSLSRLGNSPEPQEPASRQSSNNLESEVAEAAQLRSQPGSGLQTSDTTASKSSSAISSSGADSGAGSEGSVASAQSKKQAEGSRNPRPARSRNRQNSASSQGSELLANAGNGFGSGGSSRTQSEGKVGNTAKTRTGEHPATATDVDNEPDENAQQKTSSAPSLSLNTRTPSPSREAGGLGLPPIPLDRPDRESVLRGGKGGVKKSRGVPSLILGVPTRDYFSGTPNANSFKTKQEKIPPQQLSTEPQQAQRYFKRRAMAGQVVAPEVSEQWQRTLIKNYFLSNKRYLKSAAQAESKNTEESNP
ncbi:hypothetical protein QSV34_03160 [Porticoccus sp. W117]|uniref:hypothetical protein n=1 Tax=Porticoccus sp. W117 TaxID=3054777 RepID=UPI002596A4AB|nr:hypothetical protein [Porticoccus sp. W117]MDM3870348.1 hypothetical protein [Porticoccus sp. W117]